VYKTWVIRWVAGEKLDGFWLFLCNFGGFFFIYKNNKKGEEKKLMSVNLKIYRPFWWWFFRVY
jgi:hypothetical protein